MPGFRQFLMRQDFAINFSYSNRVIVCASISIYDPPCWMASSYLPVSNKLFLYGPSGCGKTLAAYVLSGELKRPVYVVNAGAVVSSKPGNTSKNLSKLFHKAARSEAILFFDEFDTLGKLRDYRQDHAEMKRVVNTFLQLFDYLPNHVV